MRLPLFSVSAIPTPLARDPAIKTIVPSISRPCDSRQNCKADQERDGQAGFHPARTPPHPTRSVVGPGISVVREAPSMLGGVQRFKLLRAIPRDPPAGQRAVLSGRSNLCPTRLLFCHNPR